MYEKVGALQMAGINTGILTNAHPLNAEQIKALEQRALETNKAFVYLDEQGQICFTGVNPELVKDLAWHNTYELKKENELLTKKVYKKTTLDKFFQKETLQKESYEDTWVQVAYNITTNLYNCWGYSTNPTQIDGGEEITLQFVPYSSCTLPSSIYVSGAEYSWYWSSGTLILRNPTGPVYVSISCVTVSACCFVAGTPVLMHDGNFKKIEEVSEGDVVITYNEESKIYEPGTITGTIVKPDTWDMARVTFEDNSSVVMNAYHPMYTQEGWKSLVEFEELGILTENDSVLSTDSKWLKIVAIDRWVDENVITYNLDVEVNDNFFVGKTPVMVHNLDEFVPSISCKPGPEILP